MKEKNIFATESNKNSFFFQGTKNLRTSVPPNISHSDCKQIYRQNFVGNFRASLAHPSTVNVNVKQSRYRPGQAQRVPGI